MKSLRHLLFLTLLCSYQPIAWADDAQVVTKLDALNKPKVSAAATNSAYSGPITNANYNSLLLDSPTQTESSEIKVTIEPVRSADFSSTSN